MPNSVEDHVLADDVIADSIRPDLQTPLSHPLALELLDLRWGTGGGGLQPFDRFENLVLD